MKLGLQIPYFTWPGGPPVLGAKLAELGRAAEGVGYGSIWVMAHFVQIPMAAAAEMGMAAGADAGRVGSRLGS